VRTCEQGDDYLIELEDDTLSVYGSPAIQFLERPWNRQRAERASTVQFHFVAFDELVSHLGKFRENFPNIEHFEFTETNIHSMNQINALAAVQVHELIFRYMNSYTGT
jgi:leucine-rich repeat-containing protein 49